MNDPQSLIKVNAFSAVALHIKYLHCSLNQVFNTSAKLSEPNDSLSSYVKNFQLKVDSAKSGFRFKLCFDEIRQVS